MSYCEEGGYKLETEDIFGFAQYELNDAMTRPHPQKPCMTRIPGHDRFAYITETERIAVVSSEFFSFAQEIGNVKSLCAALPDHLLALTEVEGEGRLYLLNEDGDVLGQKEREEAFVSFPSTVTLLSSVFYELVCFQDPEGIYVMDLKFGAIFDLQVPKGAQVRYCKFIDASHLLCNWVAGTEGEWLEFTLKTRGEEAEIERRSLPWEGYLGQADSGVITFHSNDAAIHDLQDFEKSSVISHLGYIAASKTDKLCVSANDKLAVILTSSHLHIYERNYEGSWGKQWIKAMPPNQKALGTVMLGNHFFILLPTNLISILLAGQ